MATVGSELDRIDYDDLAKVALKMAKHVKKVKPDAILLPLRSGYATGKLVMEALRRNLGVSILAYDPPVICTFMNHHPECDPRVELEKLKNAYPDFKKLMIIDSTNQGLSPSIYLETLVDSNEFGKIYVNLMGADYPQSQKEELDRFKGKLRLKISRLKSKGIPFDDRNDLMGITEGYEYNEVVKKNTYNYFPYGCHHYQGLKESQTISEEFFLRSFEALKGKK